MKLLLALFVAFVASPAWAGDHSVENYTIRYEVEGESVLQVINVLPERILEHPEVIESLAKVKLDHIAYFTNEREGRNPSQTEQEDETLKALKKVNAPIEAIKTKKSIRDRLKMLWRQSFPKTVKSDFDDVLATKTAKQLALVSTISAAGSSVILIATDLIKNVPAAELVSSLSVYDCVRVVVIKSMIAYYTTRYIKGIGNLFEKSWRFDRNASQTSFFLKRLAYNFLLTELAGFANVGTAFLSPEWQLTVLGNSALYGILDGWVSNLTVKKYSEGLTEAESLKRVSLINFWAGGLPAYIAAADLQKHSMLPSIMEFGYYDFRWGSVALLAVEIPIIIALYANPEGLYKVISKTNGFLNLVINTAWKSVASWTKQATLSCNVIYRGVLPPEFESLPPNDALPE